MNNSLYFNFNINGDNEWEFISDNIQTHGWMAEMGRIMGLNDRISGIRPDLISIVSDYFDSDEPKILLRSKYNEQNLLNLGNQVLDFSQFRFYQKSDGRWNNIICEFQNSISDSKTLYISQYISQWMATRFIFSQSVFQGGIPFHAALAEYNGKGILIAAPGDTGKTTCSGRLSKEKGWTALCDDEALVVLTKTGEYRVHPFPTWSHYFMNYPVKGYLTWNVQSSVPLSAIFFLKQAEKDAVFPITKGKSAIKINEAVLQVYMRFCKDLNPTSKRSLYTRIFDNCCELAKKIPAYSLHATLDGKFWEKIEEVIS